jgi:signal peptide peptidase SppA
MHFLNNHFFAFYGLHAQLAAVLSAVASGTHKVSAAVQTRPPYLTAEGVAIIDIKGPIMRGIGAEAAAYYGLTDTDLVNRAVRLATEAVNVDSILIRVNSGGGSVDGLLELTDRVKQAASIKPTVAVVDGMAASAAYWIAASTNQIIAGKRDLVGSIGTRLTLVDTSKLYESMGIKVIPVDTGPYKSAGAAGTEITDEHVAEFQRIVDGYFADFSGDVKERRGLSAEQLATVADGRVFFANEAPLLVDAIGSFESVLKSLQDTSAARQRFNRM